MPQILSESVELFKIPQSYKISDRTYKNVHSVSSKTFMDGDSLKKTVNNIIAEDGDYFCISNGKNIEYSSKKYRIPVSRVIDGKQYNDIFENVMDNNGNKTYSIQPRHSNHIKNVTVNKDGHIINTNFSGSFTFFKSVGKSFKLLSKVFK